MIRKSSIPGGRAIGRRLGIRRRRMPPLRARGQCGECGAHHTEAVLFNSVRPGDPIYFRCKVCGTWSEHEVIAIERADP